MSIVEKRDALEALKAEVIRSTQLPLSTNLVFGEGSADADVLFIGEAPGKNEDLEIRPFVGRGGQLLRRCIRDLGWKEADVYITNIVKRRPPENRDPTPEEIAAYAPYLSRQIAIINPKIIVPLGRFSMSYFLPNGKITRDEGKAFRVGAQTVVPMLHPAAALRGTTAMHAFLSSFKKLPDIIAGATPVTQVAVSSSGADSENASLRQDVLF